MTSGPPYRVAQWATGTIGRRALRAIIEHPAMTLTGVHVHSPEKSGLDAGELCAMPPVGVRATTDIEHILASHPDCVLYMPIVPLALLSLQRELTGLTIDEYADLSRRPSPELLFDVMGFGRPAPTADPHRAAHLRESFGPSLRLVAQAVGLPLDELTAHADFACARSDIEIAAGTIPAGGVAAQRVTVTGLRAGAPLLTFRASWYCTAAIDTDWRLGDTGWHVSVAGDAPLEADIRLAVDLDRMAEVSPGYTAHRAVNAIPAVCAAEPGIRSSTQLPQIVPDLRPGRLDPLSSIS